jgi:hypothetical protein
VIVPELSMRAMVALELSVNQTIRVRAEGHTPGTHGRCRNGEFGHGPSSCDSTDLVGVRFGEPEAPIGPRHDADRVRAGGRISNSVIAPVGVIRPTLPIASRNQQLPSGPRVIPTGDASDVVTDLKVMTPDGVEIPIRFPPSSVNQRFPSDPVVIAAGRFKVPVSGYSVIILWA